MIDAESLERFVAHIGGGNRNPATRALEVALRRDASFDDPDSSTKITLQR